MTSRWKLIKDSLSDPNSVKPWDVIDPKTEWVEDSIKDLRYSICKECPDLLPLTKQCKHCMCVMKIKTGLLAATCPLGKW